MDRYLMIGEAAELLGVTRKALRHYEKLGLVMPERGDNGYRQYGPEEILRLQRVRQLQSLGLSLARIKRVLGEHDNESLWSSVLESLLDEIEGEIALLEVRRERVAHILDAGVSEVMEGALTEAPGVQEYLDQHFNTEMWLREKEVYAALSAYRSAENQADVLAAAELIVALAQSPMFAVGRITMPDADPVPLRFEIR